MSKNIAILFAGRVKAYENCYASYLKYVIEPLVNKGYKSYIFLSHNNRNENYNLNVFNSLYDVKDFENISFDKFEEYSHIPCHISTRPHNAYPMFYHIERAFSLMEKYSQENNITFDSVLYMRADQLLEEPLSIQIDTLEENSINIPEGEDYSGLNDQMAYGTFDSMKKYLLFSNIKNLWEDHKVPFHPESYVLLNTNLKGLHVKRFPLKYSLHHARYY